jgi:hypothetical protein
MGRAWARIYARVRGPARMLEAGVVTLEWETTVGIAREQIVGRMG